MTPSGIQNNQMRLTDMMQSLQEPYISRVAVESQTPWAFKITLGNYSPMLESPVTMYVKSVSHRTSAALGVEGSRVHPALHKAVQSHHKGSNRCFRYGFACDS